MVEGLAGPITPEQKDYLGTILSKADQLLGMITSVLDVAGPLIGPGDAVLVKASRAVGLEGIAEEITNFARAWSPS